MSATAASLQNLAARPGASSQPAHSNLLLQRKCACGAQTSSLASECTECSSRKRLQARLAIGQGNDPLEREADRVADEVMAGVTHGAPSKASPHIQRLSGHSQSELVSAPSNVHGVLADPGRPLEPELRRDMAQRFGHDFSDVRVHSDAAAERSASDINAQAYTVGRDIVFGTGLYAPGTWAGRRLLAHELTHVVQQAASATPLLRRAPAPALVENETEAGAGTAAETEDDARAEDPADGYEAGAENEVAPDNGTAPGEAMDSDLASNAADETQDAAPDPVPLQSAPKKPATGKWILVKLPGTLIRFDGTKRIDSWGISGGRSGHATPTGKFSIFNRDENHRSSSYGKCSGKPIGPNGQSKCSKQGGTYVGADMHYFQEFASQVGFHRGDPAVPSHGCIHVNAGNAQTLWNWSATGTPVIVCAGSGCDAYMGSGASSKGKGKGKGTGKSKTLQRRLAIGIADDPLEREADRVADQVLAGPATPALRSASPLIQRFAQRPGTAAQATPASVDRVLASPGGVLEPALSRDMAQQFGHDFSQVRVHCDEAARQSAREVDAHAYTVGQHVVFGAGRFTPSTREGRWLLAHELTHVVQQSPASRSSERADADPREHRLSDTSHASLISRSSPLQLARYEPSPQYMPAPMTRPSPGAMPSPGTLVPETGPSYATEPATDFYEMYERAKKAPDCESAELELEIPVATLAHGGRAPDFVTDERKQIGKVQNGNTFCSIPFTPRAFHILDAIEHAVEQATTNAHLKAALDKYIDDRKPVGLVPSFIVPPSLDPGGVTRVQIYAAAVKQRMASGFKFDSNMDPTLVLPEDLPADALQKGCRVTPGRGLFDPRYEPQFDNWMAATYCQQVTGSLFEYRVTAPNGDFAIYDGKKGSVVYECKCGYESIQNVTSDDPRKRARAEQKLIAIMRQKDNHVRVAQACGLVVTYKVSSEFLANTLRSAWSDVSVEHGRILGFPTESCAP